MTPEQREELKLKMQGYIDNPAEPRSCNPAAILSLIAQVEALTVPQGWKCVPVEPTSKMDYAGTYALPELQSGCSAIYAAMLDAAPTIPAIPGTKEGA